MAPPQGAPSPVSAAIGVGERSLQTTRKVAAVRTQLQHGKIKRQGRFSGQRPDWKKAWVRLKAGEKVPEFLEGA